MSDYFLDHKKRNLILWVTDMLLAIVSYFYMTNPFYIRKILDSTDFATLRPDVDPELFKSPVFYEMVETIVPYVALLFIGLIAVIHTVAFYKCYLRKTAAITYVKVYCFLAAFSLVLWLIYNFHLKNMIILIPTVIYAMVFMAERQPGSPQSPLDNVLASKND